MKTNDFSIPKIGLGTYGLTGEAGTKAVLAAMEIGYRHIDTAQTYDTEKPIGSAIDSVIDSAELTRDDLFITTKITPENFTNLRDSLRESCDNLRVDAVDLTLIHWPAHYDKVPVSDYIGELLRAQTDGQTRLIGVSNFTRKHLQEVDAAIGKNMLATNQFECHAYLQNRVLAEYCDETDLQVTAYMPLAVGKLATDPVTVKIGAEQGVEASQIALAYLLQKGYVIIPKSATPARMASNLAASNITLTDNEMMQIDALDRNERIVDPEWGPSWD